MVGIPDNIFHGKTIQETHLIVETESQNQICKETGKEKRKTNQKSIANHSHNLTRAECPKMGPIEFQKDAPGGVNLTSNGGK